MVQVDQGSRHRPGLTGVTDRAEGDRLHGLSHTAAMLREYTAPVFRRIWFPALLSLCLLFSQQAAFVHELGHLASSKVGTPIVQVGNGGDAKSAAQSPAAAELCGTCLAYAQMAAALPSAWQAADLGSQRHQQTSYAAPLPVSTPAPQASIRDPPRFL